MADDLKNGLEVELKDLDAQIRQGRREANLVPDLAGKLALRRAVKDLEARRNGKRRELYEAQDDIDARKEELISGVEARLHQTVTVRILFTLGWQIQ